MSKKTTLEQQAAGVKKVFITPQELAATGIGSARTIMKKCANGELRAVKFGNSWRIYAEDVNAKYGLAL